MERFIEREQSVKEIKQTTPRRQAGLVQKTHSA